MLFALLPFVREVSECIKRVSSMVRLEQRTPTQGTAQGDHEEGSQTHPFGCVCERQAADRAEINEPPSTPQKHIPGAFVWFISTGCVVF